MNISPRQNQTGMTLLEITTVIVVLLGLITVLLIGAKAFKDGADRSKCILNIRSVQIAVRSYQNIYGLSNGDDLEKDIIINETSGFVQYEPECPSSGDYQFALLIPEPGDLVLTCSNADALNHSPSNHGDW